MRTGLLVDVAHYGGLLVLAVLLAAVLAALVASTLVMPLPAQASALAGAFAGYLACATLFAAFWPDAARGDAILLGAPGIVVVAMFLTVAVMAPQPTSAGETRVLAILTAEALVVMVGAGAGAALGRTLALRRRG